MPVGFQSITDTGVVQIDQDTQAWQLKTKGTVVYDQILESHFISVPYGIITVVSSTTPILAITGDHAIRNVYKSGTTWRFFVIGLSGSATYYVFEKATALVETFGLAIYDEDGNICFQSGGKPLRIVGVGPATYTSGRDYAVAVLSVETSNEEEINEDEETEGAYITTDFLTIRGASVSANVVSFINLDVAFYVAFSSGVPISYGNWTAKDPQLLIVDVTNY